MVLIIYTINAPNLTNRTEIWFQTDGIDRGRQNYIPPTSSRDNKGPQGCVLSFPSVLQLTWCIIEIWEVWIYQLAYTVSITLASATFLKI